MVGTTCAWNQPGLDTRSSLVSIAMWIWASPLTLMKFNFPFGKEGDDAYQLTNL